MSTYEDNDEDSMTIESFQSRSFLYSILGIEDEEEKEVNSIATRNIHEYDEELLKHMVEILNKGRDPTNEIHEAVPANTLLENVESPVDQNEDDLKEYFSSFLSAPPSILDSIINNNDEVNLDSALNIQNEYSSWLCFDDEEKIEAAEELKMITGRDAISEESNHPSSENKLLSKLNSPIRCLFIVDYSKKIEQSDSLQTYYKTYQSIVDYMQYNLSVSHKKVKDSWVEFIRSHCLFSEKDKDIARVEEYWHHSTEVFLGRKKRDGLNRKHLKKDYAENWWSTTPSIQQSHSPMVM
ncbi:hypothetical protein BDB01DRAFT_832526 [Pilobolus umbonatus]|nr:hypothetical protein BDB01DRAFT_832526 [Pilobolus umbonatus]